jgi:hypothetical protein
MFIPVGTASRNIPVEAVKIVKECSETGEDINSVDINMSITVNQQTPQSDNMNKLN